MNLKKSCKYPLLFLLLLLFSSILSGEEKENNSKDTSGTLWQKDFRAARKEALHSHKLLLLFFTISDRSYGSSRTFIQTCKNSRNFLLKAKKDYLFLHVDLPENRYTLPAFRRRHNIRLRSRFNVTHFPCIVCVDPRSPWGNMISKDVGIFQPTELLLHLEKKISSHLKRVRDARKKALKQEK